MATNALAGRWNARHLAASSIRMAVEAIDFIVLHMNIVGEINWLRNINAVILASRRVYTNIIRCRSQIHGQQQTDEQQAEKQ